MAAVYNPDGSQVAMSLERGDGRRATSSVSVANWHCHAEVRPPVGQYVPVHSTVQLDSFHSIVEFPAMPFFVISLCVLVAFSSLSHFLPVSTRVIITNWKSNKPAVYFQSLTLLPPSFDSGPNSLVSQAHFVVCSAKQSQPFGPISGRHLPANDSLCAHHFGPSFISSSRL